MEKLTILIIDDDKVDRKNYIRFLTENPLFQTEILEAENSKKGIDLWEQNSIDCILLDYNLPGSNGLEVLKNIKNTDKEFTPIIMLTGMGNEHIAVTAMKEGAADYIIKDEINAHILVTAIANATNQLQLKKQIEMNRKLEAEKQIAEEQYRLKNEFLSNMSHELRTPLNPIFGFAQLLFDGTLGQINQEQKDALTLVLTSAHHLLQIINNAIEITEFETGEIVLSPQEFTVSQSLSEVVNSLSTLSNAKQLKINCQIDKKVSQVYLDRVRVKEILYNYLSNAIKFTPQGGSVDVRVKIESDKKFRLEVEDSGIGIEPDNIEKLFTTFQQLDSSITKEYQGAGLGLSLTKHIAEALGGYVGVNSTPGKGSIFYAVLPIKSTSVLMSPVE